MTSPSSPGPLRSPYDFGHQAQDYLKNLQYANSYRGRIINWLLGTSQKPQLQEIEDFLSRNQHLLHGNNPQIGQICTDLADEIEKGYPVDPQEERIIKKLREEPLFTFPSDLTQQILTQGRITPLSRNLSEKKVVADLKILEEKLPKGVYQPFTKDENGVFIKPSEQLNNFKHILNAYYEQATHPRIVKYLKAKEDEIKKQYGSLNTPEALVARAQAVADINFSFLYAAIVLKYRELGLNITPPPPTLEEMKEAPFLKGVEAARTWLREQGPQLEMPKITLGLMQLKPAEVAFIPKIIIEFS